MFTLTSIITVISLLYIFSVDSDKPTEDERFERLERAVRGLPPPLPTAKVPRPFTHDLIVWAILAAVALPVYLLISMFM